MQTPIAAVNYLALLLFTATPAITLAPRATHGAEAFGDPDTLLSFPETLGTWRQSRVHEFDQPGLGRSISYNDALRGAITLYIYNLGRKGIPTGGDDAGVLALMQQTMREVDQAWKQHGAAVEQHLAIHRLVAPGARAAAALVGAHTFVDERGTHSSITLLTGYRGNYVKLRYTRTEEGFDRTWADLLIFLQSLRDANRNVVDPLFRPDAYEQLLVPPSGLGIDVHHNARSPSAMIWTAYCVMRADDVTAHPERYSAAPGEELVPTFDIECKAREAALKIYTRMLADRAIKRDRYWSDLALVDGAGLLREYVWIFHRRASWLESEAPSQLPLFSVWAKAKLKNHKPVTEGRITRKRDE